MTRAFDLNLAALGLLALVFGVFLVYNSMTFSVVQRRGLIGLLRAQGVTRREVLVVVMAEALALGVVATILGCLLGVVLGAGLVRLVARTINDLYFALAVSGVTLMPWSLGKAVALGIGATAAASIPPAREATSTPPRSALLRSVLETRARASAGALALAGGGLIVLGLLGLLLPARGLRLSFAALFVVVMGGALLAPAVTVVVSRAVRPLAGRAFGIIGRMAARGVPATLSRTGPAIAALAVALAAGFAVATMIDSFRGTVATWLDGTLRADVYVSAPGTTANRSDTPLDAGLAGRIRAVPGVAGVSTYRNVVVPAGAEDVRVVAVDLYEAHRQAFDLLEGDAARIWPAFDSGTAILVSESFGYRRGLGAGDTLRLPGAAGTASFRVGGVFRDYASEHGVVFMSRAAYDARWRDRAVSSIAVFARPRTDPDTLLAALRALDTGGQEVFFRPDRALRDASLAVFDRTFAITGVLRLLALAVAFAGVLSALMALQLERAREVGVLRATGLTEGQVRGLVAAQTALMGLAAAALALPLGALLSWIMVHVINRRSFGWTMRLDFDATRLGEVVVVALGAALLAGLYPAWRLARTPPALALREE
jgi:putative ABC transport system permease protein